MHNITYKIVNFDESLAQIVVKVDVFDSPFTIDLPVDSDGNVPEGEVLDQYIRGFIPVWEIERREKLKNGVANASQIIDLVTPLPTLEIPTPVEPTIEETRQKMVVSAFQARSALHLAGYLAEAEDFVEASDDPVIKLAWEYAVEFKRLSPTILAAQEALNISDEEMDQLFELAKTIEA